MEVTHLCPTDSDLTPCCGRSPFDLPLNHRITLHKHLVNCIGGAVELKEALERARAAGKRASSLEDYE